MQLHFIVNCCIGGELMGAMHMNNLCFAHEHETGQATSTIFQVFIMASPTRNRTQPTRFHDVCLTLCTAKMGIFFCV